MNPNGFVEAGAAVDGSTLGGVDEALLLFVDVIGAAVPRGEGFCGAKGDANAGGGFVAKDEDDGAPKAEVGAGNAEGLLGGGGGVEPEVRVPEG